jgi:hypothetical protein
LVALKLPPDLPFPLSPDHCFITLVQYNVKRGLLSNLSILGLLDVAVGDESSCQELPGLTFPPPAMIPPSLRPTPFQSSQRYSPIIASLPFPKVREDMIRNASLYDLTDIAADVYGGLFDGPTTLDLRGVLVWGEPWMPEAWEFTEAIIMKWRWILRDVSELVSVTNRWRDIRGEPRLVIEQ